MLNRSKQKKNKSCDYVKLSPVGRGYFYHTQSARILRAVTRASGHIGAVHTQTLL